MIEQIGELMRRGAEALRGFFDPHGRLTRQPGYAPVPVPIRGRSYPHHPRRYR